MVVLNGKYHTSISNGVCQSSDSSSVIARPLYVQTYLMNLFCSLWDVGLFLLCFIKYGG